MKIISTIIQFILSIFLGASVGYVSIASFDGELSIYGIFIIIIFVVITLILQLMIHEAGHLCFGIMTGYQFISYRIGNIMFIKEDNHFKIKKFSLAGTLGQCLLAPPDYNNNQYPVLLYNMGGSIFNLAISLISFYLFLIINNSYLSLFCFLLAILGIYFGLTNGIPLSMSGLNNDGMNALQTYKHQDAKKAFWKTLKINELNSYKIRLKDMDEYLFEDISIEDLKTELSASLLIVNYQRALDQEDFNKAKTIINFIDEHSVPLIGIHGALLTNDKIYLDLVFNQTHHIDSYYTKTFKKFQKAMQKQPSFIRTQYTYELLYKHDSNAAQSYLDMFDKISKSYPYTCDIESEKELIHYAYHIYLNREK